jgi:uncharacterized protein YjhX (UPF0386 family)
MKMNHKIVAGVSVLALAAAPALAQAGGNGHGPTQPGPNASPNAKAKAYGKFCQTELKKHVKGMKGTPFSVCVTGMAKAAHNAKMSARTACKGELKKHVKGMKGTPFSVCVSGVAKLRNQASHSSSVPVNQGTSNKPSTPAGPPSTTPPQNQGTDHKPSTPGPNASLPAKAKAYGKLCQAESKKHVAGMKGTPFSVCVTGMAKAAHDAKMSARTACKGEAKKHVKGMKNTPFSECVSGVAKLRNQASHS